MPETLITVFSKQKNVVRGSDTYLKKTRDIYCLHFASHLYMMITQIDVTNRQALERLFS